jgi:hypothetical protein
MRARDHGIVIGHGAPGPENAITDVTHALPGERLARAVTEAASRGVS